MYENHWNLTRRPFEDWVDDAAYYPAEAHQTSMLKLRYALESRRSALVLGGDSGMGKSLLSERLIAQLPEPLSPVATIAYPQLSGEQLLGYLADKLTGIPGPADEPPRLTLARLESFLEQNLQRQRHAVVVVDEAHLLDSSDQLETLRLLLNLPATGGLRAESAWTLILVGQTTLMNLVEQHRSLDERVSVKCLLHRFSADQTAGYLQHRLAAAGGEIDRVFSPEAVEAIHLRSAGIPRRIGRLADLALMVGFAEELPRVEAAHIEGVHRELVS